jgi:hypothetical protein
MTAEDFRKLYYTEPFQPFHVLLHDGREFPVAERNHLTINPTGRRIAIAPRIEDLEIIEMKDIAGIRNGAALAGSASP